MATELDRNELRIARIRNALMPFADVHTEELPLSRVLRLSLFQVSVGMALVLITGTLNRVMIVELGVAAWFVAFMIALPVVFAPLRALIGFRSDQYQSAFGIRRIPFIWAGTLAQWGGLAIMPFAVLILSGDGHGPIIYGQLGAGLAFLLVGAGLHTTQTAGLALASDLSRPDLRPRIVALLFVMLLAGMVLSSLVFGWLLQDFTPARLIRVIQGAAVVTLVLNLIALWKQEPRGLAMRVGVSDARSFRAAWGELQKQPTAMRLLVATAIGTAGFTMQDILLEPFGGQILGLSVSATTLLTSLLAGGMLIAFMASARSLGRGMDPHRLAAYGALLGVIAFSLIAIVGVLQNTWVFAAGVSLIGIGGGLFAVGTLTAAMGLSSGKNSGLALGAWGAVQATATGIALASGGALRDVVSRMASNGSLGETLESPVTGYAFVYSFEVFLLFATLAAIGPLAAFASKDEAARKS